MHCTNPECPDIEKYGIPGNYHDGIETCPKCGARLVASETTESPVVRVDAAPVYENLLWLYSPRSEGELALVRSVLLWAGIRHCVHNNYFGAMRVGPDIDLLNRRTIMVPERHAEEARELLLDYIEATSEENVPLLTRDRLRIVLEFVVFGWFLPGKMRSRKYYDALESHAAQSGHDG
jgi:hypothetical protein